VNSRILVTLQAQAEAEGFEPGTKAFADRLLALKVAKCQEMRGLYSCAVCKHLEYCDLAKEFSQIARR
jgi:hypothetical protein